MTITPRHRQILTESQNLLSEELMADAVIIAITRRRRNSTETFVVSDGNLHTLRGVAEYIYAKFCEDPDLEDDEDDEIQASDENGDDNGDQ